MEVVVEMERCGRDVRGVSVQMGQYVDELVCFEEKNGAAIYRGMKGKKKTMKEIKKEKKEKWNFEWKIKEIKEMVSDMVELSLTI